MKLVRHRKDYVFLLGEASRDLFDYYDSELMGGLRLDHCLLYPESNEDVFIAGMSNYAVDSKVPFVFINSMRFQNNYKDVTLIMHEMVHMSLLVHEGNVKEEEEEIVTWAEEETNYIMRDLLTICW